MYASYEDYKKSGGKLDEQQALAALEAAGRDIDVLTYNRIVAAGFDSLTTYQQKVVKECACMLADWKQDNADYTGNVLSSYALNGASMTFSGESAGAVSAAGIVTSREVYAYLMRTGLCCRRLP